ncbi:MAG: methionyl-tRNA formyltransferase [Cyanobacteriota bacterium]|nr:methionyl-tRNA formyltransferase [Cyanobacteriota bacterium]
MRVVFWGTPTYAVPTLEELHGAEHTIVGVVSQPDRRRGRGGSLTPSPVKQRALELGLKVFTPERVRRDLAFQDQLARLDAEISVVVAYGQILPKPVLDQPPLGCWNGHGSLLPRWRGAAPIQWALLEGDGCTGVGIMAMEEGLDTGPVLLEERLSIGLLDNGQQLGDRLSALTAKLFLKALPRIAAAGVGPQLERWERLGLQAQSEDGITYARLLRREDYQLNWNESALQLHRRVMALFPGAQTHWQGLRLKIWATEPLSHGVTGELTPEAAALVLGGHSWPEVAPGEVLALKEGVGVVVGTGDGALLLREAQLEGKRACKGTALVQQLNAKVGDRMGESTSQGQELQQSVLSGASDSSTPEGLD